MGDKPEEYNHNAKDKNKEINMVKDEKTGIEFQILNYVL